MRGPRTEYSAQPIENAISSEVRFSYNHICPHAPALADAHCLEATGGLEVALTGALAAAGLPVVGVNPRQVRDFAKATGTLAKHQYPRCGGLDPR